MKIRVFREFGAMNSSPVFDAFERGVLTTEDSLVSDHKEADVLVIWSVLFKGRMAGNQKVWDYAQRTGKPVVVLEVGTLLRNQTWRMGINGINRDATFANDEFVPYVRRGLFDIKLKPWQDNNKEFVTIATQRPDSQQWVGMPSVESWLFSIIEKVKDVTDRPIVIRPHPRDSITDWMFVHHNHPDVFFDRPVKTGDYDSVNFGDILQRTHLLINHCTSPAIEAVIKGVPVAVGEPSMCWDVKTDLDDIEKPNKPDREIWFDKLLHTEYFTYELEVGWPWKRLREYL